MNEGEGYPSEMKGDEVNPFEVLPLKEEEISAREGELAPAPEQISSSGEPAAANSVALEKAWLLEGGNGAAPGSYTSARREGLSPDGEASPSTLVMESTKIDTPTPGNVNVQAPQQVSGAADGPRGDAAASLPARVVDFGAVDASELQSRLVALPGSPVYQRLEHLLGAQDLPTMLSERTRTGKLPRTRWLQLTLAEVKAVEVVALVEEKAGEIPLRTLVTRGLDRLIGSTWNGQKKPASTPVTEPVIGGQSLEILPRKAAAPAEPAQPEEGRLLPGARYRRKSDDGVIVELLRTERVKNRADEGKKWVLSDGSRVSALDLRLKFEFVDRAHASD